MIALSILSVLLIASTVILIQIGALYTKGVDASSLENTNRQVISDVSSQIQYGSSNIPSCTSIINTCYANVSNTYGYNLNVYAYCIGNIRYTYILDVEQGTDSHPLSSELNNVTIPVILWRDTITPTGACEPLDILSTPVMNDNNSEDGNTGASNGYSMMQDRTRLTEFNVQAATSAAYNDLYNIDIGMAFGDGDLLSLDTTNTDPTQNHTACLGVTGQQYCDISNLSSTVEARLY